MSLLDTESLLVLVSTGLLLVLIRFYLEFKRSWASVGNHSGFWTILDETALLSQVLPRIPGISLGCNQRWDNHFRVFQRLGWDIYSTVALWPRTITTIHVANLAAVKEITGDRARWPKPLEMYDPLNFYGSNILTTEGNEWKKHRKITAPAFAERNTRVVWDETLAIMNDLLENVWGTQESISYDHAVDFTMPLTLFIISAAGFGRRINYSTNTEAPYGHTMNFKDAVHNVAMYMIARTMTPAFFWKLTPHLRMVDRAFKELRQYIVEMIETRRNAEVKETRYDVLSTLLDANDEEGKDGKPKVTIDELIGNAYLFIIAGHETTAHTLVWMLALLALHPDEQEKLYQHVKKVMPKGRFPTYEEMPLFAHSLAATYETLRLFPPVPGIPKQAGDDSTLIATNPNTGERKAIPVPKGTYVYLDTPALHHNPEHWVDPDEFQPERFLKKDWPRDAFIPFSAGSRSCLGRKFTETETVAMISVIIHRYSIHVKEEPQFANETFEQRKARLYRARPGLTHTPIRVPITFKRRKEN